MRRIGSEPPQTARPTLPTTQKPAGCSNAESTKLPQVTDAFERQAKGGALFQAGGKSTGSAGAVHEVAQERAVGNLGHALSQLDAKLGLSAEKSLSSLMTSLWTEAGQQRAEARLDAKATALAAIGEKSALALDKLRELNSASEDVETKFVTAAVVGSLQASMAVLSQTAVLASRSDAKNVAPTHQLEDMAKAAKISHDNAQIDQQMSEANQKADSLMEAATSALIMGAVSGAVQIAGGAASVQSAPQFARGVADKINPGMVATGAAGRMDDLLNRITAPEVDARSKTQDLKQKANQREAEDAILETQAEKADESQKDSADHSKTIKDAIQKMLAQIAEINRATDI